MILEVSNKNHCKLSKILRKICFDHILWFSIVFEYYASICSIPGLIHKKKDSILFWQYCSGRNNRPTKNFKFSILPWHLEQTFAAAAKSFKIHLCELSEFSCFIQKIGSMHACILHVLSTRLTRVTTRDFHNCHNWVHLGHHYWESLSSKIFPKQSWTDSDNFGIEKL